MKLLGLTLLLGSSLFAQADLVNGKRMYERNGCYQCHGWVGQGGLNGPRLAQTRHTQVSFTAFLRNPPSGGMPPYRAKVMSDQEVADVYGFIKSFPLPQAAKDIPLLNQ